MAYSHCGVLCHKHHGNRLSDYKASSDNYCLFTRKINTVIFKNSHCCLGGTRRESADIAGEYSAQSSIGYSVHILCRCKMIPDFFFVHTGRQRSEHKYTVNIFIIVYDLQNIQHIRLIGLCIHYIFFHMHSKALCLFYSAFLVGDIAWVASHPQDSQCRNDVL